MATMTKSLNLRVDAELKAQAEHIFSELGLPTSTAITMFLKSVVRYGGIPLDLRLAESPNTETMAALQESDDIINGRIQAKTYNSAAELIREAQEEVNAENQADIAV